MAKKRITETQILKNDVVKAYAKTNEDIQNLQKQIDTLREVVLQDLQTAIHNLQKQIDTLREKEE